MAVNSGEMAAALGAAVLDVQFWFVRGQRWVVESDVDGGVGASTEYVVWVSWVPKLQEVDLLEAKLRHECFGYLAEVYGLLGLELPEVEVVFLSKKAPLMRVRWDWGGGGLGWSGEGASDDDI